MTPDPVEVRLALEAQAAALVPIAAHLRAAAGFQPVDVTRWLGPAASACGVVESELRARIVSAERLVAGALADTRRALAQVGS